MPNLDGFTLITALHDDPATRDTPVVVLTARDLTPADKKRLHGKILGVLTKGDKMSSQLHEWLARVEVGVSTGALGAEAEPAGGADAADAVAHSRS